MRCSIDEVDACRYVNVFREQMSVACFLFLLPALHATPGVIRIAFIRSARHGNASISERITRHWSRT
jgi:hypothetical protein